MKFRVIRSLIRINETLLVSSFEVTSVMATFLKQQGHVKITPQNSITLKHLLSGWFPFDCLLLQNWTIGWKVHSIKSNFINKAVIGPILHSYEKEVRETLFSP